MSATTVTLPLRLFGGNSDDVQNQIAREIGVLTQDGAARPDRIIAAAMGIERLRGQADVLVYLEKEFYQIVNWGVEQGWTMQQILLAQYATIAELATQAPDDTWGSRLNDGKRAYNDGRREVLAYVTGELQRSDYFPGNTKS